MGATQESSHIIELYWRVTEHDTRELTGWPSRPLFATFTSGVRYRAKKAMPPWPSQLSDWLAKPTTSGVIDAISLLVTVLGFTFTLWQVRRSRSAAQAAATSAQAVQEQISLFDAVAECAAAVQILEEVERLHRNGPSHALPDRYNQVRKSLIELRTMSHLSTAAQLAQLQDAISQLTTMKAAVEKLIATGTKLDAPKLNRITTKIISDLVELSTAFRRQ